MYLCEYLVRIHDQKLSQLRSAEKWYQITLKLSNPDGKHTYNVMEKHEKSKQFKFVKFDAWIIFIFTSLSLYPWNRLVFIGFPHFQILIESPFSRILQNFVKILDSFSAIIRNSTSQVFLSNRHWAVSIHEAKKTDFCHFIYFSMSRKMSAAMSS